MPNAPNHRPGRPGVPRWRLTRTLPTTAQLGLPAWRLLARAVVVRCPACGSGGAFTDWFHMAERCPTCTLRFERVQGHWIGSLGTNTVVVFASMLVTLLATSMLGYPDPPGLWVLWVELGIALLGPIVLFPSSRMSWTAIDLLMRPLRRGEVDPRFVVTDLGRDRPATPPGIG